MRKWGWVGALILWLAPLALAALGVLDLRIANLIGLPGLIYLAIRGANAYCKASHVRDRQEK